MSRTGRVVKVLNQWYEVQTEEGVLAARPRGRLRREGEGAPLAGDMVEVLPAPDGTARIERILPRRNRLDRPPVANVDRLLVVASWREPEIVPELVDRALLEAERRGIPAALVLNKVDRIAGQPGLLEEARRFLEPYRKAGYPVLLTAALDGTGLEELRALLAGGLTVLAGASGVGKSSLLNALLPGARLRTGTLSRAERGMHTTRHVELLPLPDGGWVADTPGFVRLEPAGLEDPREVRDAFPELARAGGSCRFRDCLHQDEPGCAVREAVARGEIDAGRYARYRALLEEVRQAAGRR
ncbi:MAG: ribosome small subunit-dependent GTPase A [Clostridia bacterium]|nr:ribosome small subunit-dependent GTPase A [Clostridia bacterium]MCL6521299.1 ribosome small subunit-dependent GTPase A [Bacillota bacterium]